MMRERIPDRREAETFEITHRTHDGVEQTFISSGTTRATAWENIHNGAIRRVEPNDPENYIALGPITSPASGERDAVIEECAGVADAEAEQHRTNYRNGGRTLDHYYATAAENVAAAIRALRMMAGK